MSKDNEPEVLIRKFLFKHGFRCWLYIKNLLDKRYIVLGRYRPVIIVYGMGMLDSNTSVSREQ